MATLGAGLPLPIKMLVMAHSGFGKTGALASLAKDYKLHILDLDNGTEILIDKVPKEFYPNVEIETIQDKFKIQGTKAVAQGAVAWSKALSTLDMWAVKYNTPEHIIVIDSLTMLSTAALRHIMMLNNRLASKPYQSDWGEAQTLIEDVLGLLYSKDLKANVIVNTHITYLGGPDPYADKSAEDTAQTVQPLKGYPTSLGKALSPKIARYFNNALVGKTIGDGRFAQRLLYTDPVDLVDSKIAAPGTVKSTYPIATGLADIFRALRPSVATPTLPPATA